MPDNDGLLLAKRTDETDHVADDVEYAVRRDFARRVGASIAAHVGRDRVISGGGERRQLIAPGIPPLRKTVAQENKRSRSLLGEVNADAVGPYIALLKIFHRHMLSGGWPIGTVRRRILSYTFIVHAHSRPVS